MLYEIKVELKEIEPAIWRVLRVRPQTSLSRLHKVLQKAMGWTNSHLHLFEIDGQVYSEGGIDWESDIQDYHGMRLDKIFTEGR
ncbi:MAG: plasmid pRiA4b ORF-3 family protein, partial [Bacteroidales bacterium]|nr:plasmid pRiA4b ORF-3 family protein [Bacteroidales bacterium]